MTSVTRRVSLGAGIGGVLSRLFPRLFKDVTLAMVTIVIAAMASTAWAETLMMPKRDARTTAPLVVWGVHDQAAATPCTMDFGDGAPTVNCTGFDRSYVATTHQYTVQGTYTAKLTVGVEVATVAIQVFDPTAFADGGAAGANNRNLGINMAIQDGLRFLWTAQLSRAANFPAGTTTSWNNSGFTYADTSLVVLAFENQGYKITANVAPTGIYEKYIVRRGLNYVISTLGQVAMGITPAGNNPCVIYADCVGLAPPGDQGYTTAMAILSLAGSGALAQVNTEVAGYTNGKTYGEILQRTLNAMVWGQNDSGTGRGGWYYGFNSTVQDGSTMGWTTLALLDAAAAGATVPAFAKTEYAFGFNCGQNTNGSFDYNADCNPAGDFSGIGSPAKGGTGLLGLFLLGNPSGTPANVAAVASYINGWWPGSGGIGGNYANCNGGGGNKGCGYAMFNNFKGLKLQGIVTLPNVGRPAGPGALPANDWYADYQDWLVANQTSPTNTGGGNWSPLHFSCCADGSSLTAAIAELILSPVSLVAPDPGLFSTVGLSPATATNPVGTDHTVTAFTQAANGAPVPGVTVTFKVLTGPNAGKTGSGTTGADGKVSFTYHDDGGAGTDTIQASIVAGASTLTSNIVTKIWGLACDVNNDGKVTNADLLLIRAKNGQASTGPTDPYDANGDGVINVADVRYCQLRLTPP
ncbi:MAG TPA: dockerin type I domain-containing protein [Casimicrobiaceae bacterium]|nr:dockerin type I domain-containing protein [Casimicrobiaceae bacterium]